MMFNNWFMLHISNWWNGFPWVILARNLAGGQSSSINAGWWFGTMEFYDFPYIGNGIIIPTDKYFSEGVKPPTSLFCVLWPLSQSMNLESWALLNTYHPASDCYCILLNLPFVNNLQLLSSHPVIDQLQLQVSSVQKSGWLMIIYYTWLYCQTVHILSFIH